MKLEKEKYAELLERPEWKFYRDTVINIFGNKCQHCQSTHALQVHHKRYIDGLMPWQYRDPDDIAVLCVYCHMKEHGIIREEHVHGTMVHPLVILIKHQNYQNYLRKRKTT